MKYLCDKCDKYIDIHKKSHKRNLKNNGGMFICSNCSNKHAEACSSDGFRTKSSKNVKKLWDIGAYDDRDYSKQSNILVRKRKSETMKKLWQDGEFRNKMAEIQSSEDYKSKISKSCRERWSDPEYKKRAIEATRKACRTTSHREKMSKISKEKWLSEYRKNVAKGLSNQPKVSNVQAILYSILDDLNAKYYREYNDRQDDPECVIGPYSFDCAIPRANDKTLLIDVQGNYWHGRAEQITRDKQKASYIKDNLNHLYDFKYLWEHEFDNKDRVVNLIKYWLKIRTTEVKKFDFKEISQSIISNKDAEIFISKYHYAGRIGRTCLPLGYFIRDKLIAVITYSNPVRQEVATKQNCGGNEILELSRLAIHPDYQIKNLASFVISKSINYVKKFKTDIQKLVSFSDITFNHEGTIYKASNWIFDGEVKPSYWYVDKSGWVCHKKTLWDKSKKMGMKESEYAREYGYKKIKGDKKLRFIYKLKP